jgi:uncharacterized membrane protein
VTLAEPWPWWALVAALAGVAFLTWREYSRALIGRHQRVTLAALRAITLLLLLLFLMRPVAVSDGAPRGTVVPILVDVSRSMRIADAGGRPRIQRAREVAGQLALALGREFTVETLGFGETLDPLDPQRAEAAAPRTDLSAALTAVADRYRGRALAGIVVVSDGADTGDGAVPAGMPPIYTVPVGSLQPLRDREVAALAIGDAPLPGSLVDLTATVVSHGFDRNPIEVRVLENGRPFAARRLLPAADGAPVQEVIQVPPAGESATIYTVEIPAAADDLVPENNARSVLVPPAGRRRRLLLIEGAPGFEQSFLKRAWAADPGLELDAVVRKGQNERGDDTFYIQASTDRAPSLASGFPVDRKTLFAYDAIVLANVGAGFFGRERGDLTEAFVGERGGGLLVLGARSFAPGGVGGTAIESLLPVVLGGAPGRDATPAATGGGPNRVGLTADGRRHPILRLGTTPEETEKRWAAAPALAGVAPLGTPRPGARVLAVAGGSGSGARPLLVVQRFGEGRTVAFAGEATWRWRMMRPTEDRLYETFWRQTARWLAAPSPDPVMAAVTRGSTPRETAVVDVTVRDAAFVPARGASVSVRVRRPGGRVEELAAEPVDAAAATWRARFKPAETGVHVVTVEATRGAERVGVATRHLLTGGADLEMADPRANEAVLARLAGETGGALVRDADIDRLPGMMAAVADPTSPRATRELWHGPVPILLIIGLLSAEWIFRRRWGLR